MKLLNGFKSDDSGAVTVDWVVLTAAIVGIGISVIAAISGGVESASEEIDCGVSVASNFDFSFNKSENKTMEDYVADVNCGAQIAISDEDGPTEEDWGTIDAALAAAAADHPPGYNLDRNIVDPSTGYPVYESDDGATVSVGGEVYNAEMYYDENLGLNGIPLSSI